MPDVIDVPIPLPGDPGGTTTNEEGDQMGVQVLDVPTGIQQQTLSRLSSAGATGHEHFIQFNKILDLNYEADRKMVSLVQSLGVREVTSQSGQTGVPLAGGVAGRT